MTPSTFASLRTIEISARMGARFPQPQPERKRMKNQPPARDLVAEIQANAMVQARYPERAAELKAKRLELLDLLRQQRRAEHEEDMKFAQAMPEVCNFAPLLDPTPHRQHHIPEPQGSIVVAAVGAVLMVSAVVALTLHFFGVLR